MADAALSGLVSDVLRSLTSTAIQEFGRLRRLEADVSALNNTYTQIQAVLSDAEVKQRKEKGVETWLSNLRSASLEVENILDNALTEGMLQRLHNERGIKYKVRAFFSYNHNPLLVRAKVAYKVKAIRRKLDKIAADRSQFNLISDAVSVDDGETRNMETSSLVPTSIIYGREADMEMVAQKICSKDIVRHDTETVQVCAIWGMGGVGKTTLAQLVYNNECVREHFELQSWVYVSSEFKVKKLTRAIIESIDKCQCQLPQLDAMQVYLQNKLKGKRFFIVLDDVWNDERTKWDELSKALSSGAEGSIVMITTRNQTTSRMMAKVPEFQHKVGCLSEEDSWSLFKKFAFASGKEGGNIRELESIGKEIVDKCKGLPLAVKTLGVLMWSKGNASEWQSVNKSDVWELQENDILPALKLSYHNLHPHLKRCFAYCCLFPKGYEMGKDLLIELWMANGFIPSRGETDLYVIGEEIFNCLVSRSFLQDVQEDENSKDLVCKMHDLMHELARYVMRYDCSIINPGKELITPDEVLHLSSSSSDFFFLDQDLVRLRSLRSIFIIVDEYKGNISQISNHVYLRVLCLDGIKQSTLPESICELKHLRYLSISHSGVHFLPKSIIYLQNLQVLLVRGCTKLEKLPEGMRYMKNLRCLDNQDCYRIHCMPVGMKELRCLRRLARFVVGKKKGAQIRELGDLNLLGWGLELDGLKNVGGLEDAKSANLKCKINLVSLVLCWSGSDGFKSEGETARHDEEVVEGLEPNSSLKELEIRNYMGKMISPSWMMNLRNLVKINFSCCERCESIPSLGKLPSLRVIHVAWMLVLKCFHDDEFSGLQELHIYHCLKLVSMPSNLPNLERLDMRSTGLVSIPSNLPKLERLDIDHAPDLVSLRSNLPKLVRLDINDAPDLVSLPSNLPKLERLNIRSTGLVSLPKNLPELLKLDMHFMSLVSLPSNFPKLRDLFMEKCSKLVSLPVNLPKLNDLFLEKCEKLVSLPSNLPKLTELCIYDCPRVHCLPDGLKELTSLTIRKCENLQRRCEKEIGEDWPKISHVPCVDVSRG
ncbi:putative disease resistance protein RGA3 [Cynara cardunculus var. scolymus]|uniref:putative disease resistance protein RGA3 n=1 Tax=Cynara cardunculus var. scolymus TaxID=59895 RepID=UPI000D62E56D|nr:putative disease resistance protein RGA3 [Cynara cardunculus var. scolymus]